MRHPRLAASTALCLALALTACAPGDDEGTDGPATDGATQPVTLTVWSWADQAADQYNEIFDVFEEHNPGVTVDFIAYKSTEYDSILQTGLAGSDGPDVALIRPYGQFWPLAEGGSLVPLDDIVDFSGWEDGALAVGRGSDGKQYAVPSALTILGIYYNEDIFAEQGLEVPTTWDELLDVSEKLTAAGITPFALTAKEDWVLPLDRDIFGAAVYGGGEFSAKVKSGDTDFTDPAYVASIELLKTLQPYFPDDAVGLGYTDAQTLFVSGAAAMYPGGSWEVANWKTQAPDLNIGWFQSPAPPGALAPEGLTPAYGDGGFAIGAKSENQEAAAKLVQWTATPEFGTLFSELIGQIPVMPGATPAEPLHQLMVEAYNAHPAPLIGAVDFGSGNPSGTVLEGAEIQKVLLGQQTAEQAAQAIQTGISQWLHVG